MGYDKNRFQGDVKDEFLCPICQDVLKCPLMVPKCDHVYCGDCIHRWFNKQKDKCCPFDRIPIEPEKLTKPLRLFCSLLDELDIRCEFDQCNEIIKLGHLEKHIDNCPYNPQNKEKEIDCPNGCDTKIKLTDNEKHDCIAFMKQQIYSMKNKLDKLESTLANKHQQLLSERKKMEMEIENLKTNFQQELQRANDQIKFLKQENETLRNVLDFANCTTTKPSIINNDNTDQMVPVRQNVSSSSEILINLFVNGNSNHNEMSNSKFYSELEPNTQTNEQQQSTSPSLAPSSFNSTDSLGQNDHSKSITNKVKRKVKLFDRMFSNENTNTLGLMVADDPMTFISKNSTNPRVRRAMESINRKHFYANHEFNKIIPTKKNSHSFPLYYVIKLLELIEPILKENSTVLDVGSGTGYLTCILSKMCEKGLVVAIEHNRELVDKFRDTLKQYYQDSRIYTDIGDGRNGCDRHRPYDFILIEPYVQHSQNLDKLINQLKPNGSLAAVIQCESSHAFQLVKINKQNHREILCDNEEWLFKSQKDSFADLARKN